MEVSYQPQQTPTLHTPEVKTNKQPDWMRFAGRFAPYAPSVGAACTTAASIVALIFAIDATCSDPVGPYIATLAAAGTTTCVTLFKDIYDYRKEKQTEKKAIKKEIERSKLETTRHEEISNLLLKTLETLRRYEQTQKERDFLTCLEAIKNMPQTATERSIRELWLSHLIAISKNEEGLQTTFKEIKQIGGDILKLDQLNEVDRKYPFASKVSSGGGEGNNTIDQGIREISIGQKLGDYQMKWKAVEEKVGFPIQFLEIKGVRYDRNGMAISKEKEESESSSVDL